MNLNNKRFILLLWTLVAYFVISPFLIDTPMLAHAAALLLTLVLVSSIYVMRHEKKFLVCASILLALSLMGNWALEAGLTSSNIFQFIAYLVSMIFFCVITYYVLRYVIHHPKITINSLCGAVCGYLFIGMIWSYIYRMLYVLSPDTFTGIGLAGLNPSELEYQFTYYSFVTLTTLGYGDITPTTNVAKMFAWTQAFTGQIYLTVWIARLVALFITDNKRISPDE